MAGAGLDVFEKEPPADWTLAQMPQVVATPHIAASTEEAQELVGLDTAAAVRDFLRDGVVRNAVNFPSVHPDELQRLQPWIRLADDLAAIVAQMGPAPLEALGAPLLRRARREPRAPTSWLPSAAAGVLRPILSGGGLDRERPSRRARARHRDHRVAQHAAAPLHQPASRSSCTRAKASAGWKGPCSSRTARGWCRSTASASKLRSPERCCSSPTTISPGVIGEVGTILGRHGVNIANFALGRGETGAVGVVNVDEGATGALVARGRGERHPAGAGGPASLGGQAPA